MLSEHANRKWSFDAAHTWAASRKESRIARTVVLKLKTSEFKTLTRSHTAGFSTCFLRGAHEYRPINCYNLSASDRTSGFAWLASA